MLERSDKAFIARIGQQIISAVLLVGVFVMLYFVTVELVAYYQPEPEWLKGAPIWISIVGCLGLIFRNWDNSQAIRRLEKLTNED